MIESTIKKTVFYKERSVGQRLLASIDFLFSNVKVIFGTTFKVGLPLLFACSYFLNNIISLLMHSGFGEDYFATSLIVNYVSFAICYIFEISLLNASVASLLILSGEGQLNKKIKIKELNRLLPFTFKGFAILMIAIAAVAFFVLIGIYSENPWIMLLVGLLILFFIPFIGLLTFPMYFEDRGVVDSIIKGAKLAWSYWGTTALIMLVLTAILIMFNYFFLIPTYIVIAFQSGLSGSGHTSIASFISFFCILFSTLSLLITTPISFVCMAFQYFGVREEQEKISLKMKIDEFETL